MVHVMHAGGGGRLVIPAAGGLPVGRRACAEPQQPPAAGTFAPVPSREQGGRDGKLRAGEPCQLFQPRSACLPAPSGKSHRVLLHTAPQLRGHRMPPLTP
ncbi:unnamed protein product [Arctogadus glacialis]